MSKRNWMTLASIGSWVGIAFIASGFYVALGTDLTERAGIGGLRDDVMLIAIGLVLLIPSKIVLTLRLMDMELSQSKEKAGEEKADGAAGSRPPR